MKYYKATTEDFDYIIGLFNPNNTEFMNNSSITYENLSFPGRNNFILLADGEKIGWFTLRKTGEFGMIIDKPYQNRGFGKQALFLIEEEAKKSGLKTLRLTVNVKNFPAIKIYKRANFKETDSLIKMEKLI